MKYSYSEVPESPRNASLLSNNVQCVLCNWMNDIPPAFLCMTFCFISPICSKYAHIMTGSSAVTNARRLIYQCRISNVCPATIDENTVDKISQ